MKTAAGNDLDQNLQLAAHQAIQNSNHPNAKWPSRSRDNRLEPDCWPDLQPTFSFDRETKLFTLGSCFAQHIKTFLVNKEFNVLNAFGTDKHQPIYMNEGAFNKYTPTSILQEIEWTQRIIENGGIIDRAAIEHYLIQTGENLFVDSQRLRPLGIAKPGFDIELLINRRQEYFDIFKQIFEAEVVVLTFGLTEAWYDTQNNHYVEFGSYIQRCADPDRFVMRRLRFAECYDAVQKILSILTRRADVKVLLTTSPVPLTRTFSGEDSIVANTQSKSVLRAVVGESASEFAAVDYFPSYESVMLTKREYVWEDDLTHPNHNFIDRIMNRVIDAYVQGEFAYSSAEDTSLLISNLAEIGDYKRAVAALQDIEIGSLTSTDAKNLAGIALASEGYIDQANRIFDETSAETSDGSHTIALTLLLAKKLGLQSVAAEHLEQQFVKDFIKEPRPTIRLLRSTEASVDPQIYEIILGSLKNANEPKVNKMLAGLFHTKTLFELFDRNFSTALIAAQRAVDFNPTDQILVDTLNAVKAQEIPDWLAPKVESLR